MMVRFSTIIWIFVVVSAALGLYAVKYRVQRLKAEIAETSRQLEEERQSLHVMAAEWAYLTRPDRLERLSRDHLHLASSVPEQIADLQDVPLENEGVIPFTEDALLKRALLKQGAISQQYQLTGSRVGE